MPEEKEMRLMDINGNFEVLWLTILWNSSSDGLEQYRVVGSNPTCSQIPIKPSVGGDKVCAEALICISQATPEMGLWMIAPQSKC